MNSRRLWIRLLLGKVATPDFPITAWKMLRHCFKTASQSLDPTGFLPIDPMPRTFLRGDDMDRKAGMTCFAEPAPSQ